MTPESLFREAVQEAERHKFIESQKLGRDLGHTAIDDWQRRYWTIWLRHRWLEHLLGLRCWAELDPRRFGRLRDRFAGQRALLDEVAELVRRGAENVDIIFWAVREKRDLALVERILTEVRINDIRCSRQCEAFAAMLGS